MKNFADKKFIRVDFAGGSPIIIGAWGVECSWELKQIEDHLEADVCGFEPTDGQVKRFFGIYEQNFQGWISKYLRPISNPFF